MKIISKLPDYYDYAVGYQKDESLVLNRNVEISGDYRLTPSTIADRHFHVYKPFVSFYVYSLLFCGIRYPVVATSIMHYEGLWGQRGTELVVVSDNMLGDTVPYSDNYTYRELLFSPLGGLDPSYWELRSDWARLLKHYCLPYILGTVVASGTLKTGKSRMFKPNKNVPNLKQLGFSKIIGAEQAYQTIENFMLQELNAPDMVQLSNSDKVVKAGFDLKQSFRHRRTT